MLLLRADNPDAIPAIVRDVVRGLDSRQPVERIVAADEALRTMYAREFFMGRLVVGFALLGLMLAGTGTFGVLSHAARRRSREVAIRIAVGASPRDVTLQLVRRILPFALLGSAAGVVGGAGLGRVLGALLHGVSPADPVSLALAAFTLAATGVASAWRPIRQAVRADPATALRAEG
jgi:ABC-type antimicrobial peptide transport system permease subunit